MSKTMTATQAFEAVRESVENIRDPKAVRVVKTASVGDVMRQGDVYFVKVSDKPGDWPASAKARTNREVSKHHFVEGVELRDVDTQETIAAAAKANPELKLDTVLCGPWFSVEAPEAPAEVKHDVHAHIRCEEPGTWLSYYQREHAEEVRRTMD
jgi:hypothetical protein